MNDNDHLFAYKIRQVLNQGVEQLDHSTTHRLYEARQKALSHHRANVSVLGLAGLGNFATESLPSYGRTLIAASALVLAVVGSYYWNHFEQSAENIDVDSALLSDDLPPAAYLDKGFQAWLEQPSQSSQ